MQLNTNEAVEDKSIYDAKIESENKDGRLDVHSVLNKEKALEEREEDAKAVFDMVFDMVRVFVLYVVSMHGSIVIEEKADMEHTKAICMIGFIVNKEKAGEKHIKAIGMLNSIVTEEKAGINLKKNRQEEKAPNKAMKVDIVVSEVLPSVNGINKAGVHLAVDTSEGMEDGFNGIFDFIVTKKKAGGNIWCSHEKRCA